MSSLSNNELDKISEAAMQYHYEDIPTTAQETQHQRVLDVPPPAYDDTVNLPRPIQLSQISTSTRLTKPIAIPATTSELGSPFLRCYAPILAHYDLPRDIFLRHLDNLNRVAVANPPLQILNVSSQLVGFVPLATAQIVSAAVSTAAQVGTYGVSKGRTEMYLRELNKDVFGPRGLKVEIATLKAVAELANMPILTPDGKLDKKIPMLGELEAHELQTTSSQQRRLDVLRPWIEDLEVDGQTQLENVHVPDSRLSKVTATISERNRLKGEQKMIKERVKSQQENEKELAKVQKDFDKEMKKLEREEEKVVRKEEGKKQAKELEKISRERSKVVREYEKEQVKVGADKVKDDDEEKELRKIKWLLIRSLDDNSGSGPNPDM